MEQKIDGEAEGGRGRRQSVRSKHERTRSWMLRIRAGGIWEVIDSHCRSRAELRIRWHSSLFFYKSILERVCLQQHQQAFETIIHSRVLPYKVMSKKFHNHLFWSQTSGHPNRRHQRLSEVGQQTEVGVLPLRAPISWSNGCKEDKHQQQTYRKVNKNLAPEAWRTPRSLVYCFWIYR